MKNRTANSDLHRGGILPLKTPAPPDTGEGGDVVLRPLVRQFRVKSHGCTPVEAFYYAMQVAQQGEISTTRKGAQHCFHTKFPNGVDVSVMKSAAGIETFHIVKPNS